MNGLDRPFCEIQTSEKHCSREGLVLVTKLTSMFVFFRKYPVETGQKSFAHSFQKPDAL
jgi:hypothetical protein